VCFTRSAWLQKFNNCLRIRIKKTFETEKLFYSEKYFNFPPNAAQIIIHSLPVQGWSALVVNNPYHLLLLLLLLLVVVVVVVVVLRYYYLRNLPFCTKPYENHPKFLVVSSFS